MGEKFDWAAYYRAAFEREKKKNIHLAGRIADAEAKEADLAFRLERIQNNVFWRASAPARKCYHALKAGRTTPCVAGENRPEAEEIRRVYEREVFRQKHPYLQWIAKTEGNRPEEEIPQRNGGGRKNRESGGMEKENGDASDSRTEGTTYGLRIDGLRIIEPEEADICVVAWGDGIVDERTLEEAEIWLREKENCLFAYADEDYYWQNLSNRMHPWFKPCWSPDTMLSFCYMGHMVIVRKSLCQELLEELKGLSEESREEVFPKAFYDLCLRLEERAYALEYGISHIEEVLFHNRYEPDKAGEEKVASAKEQNRDVLEVVEHLLKAELEQGRDMTGCGTAFTAVREAALQRRGLRAALQSGAEPDIYHVVYEMPRSARDCGKAGQSGMISVVIPSKDHPETLEKCLSSFRERTEYQNYEWIIVDNGSAPENKSRVEALQEEYGFSYLYEPMEFNFSAMCNLGAASARGDYLLFLNDDIEIIEKDWLYIMAGQAGQPHTGAVGAKLWYAGGDAIQHAGITNLDIGPSHKLITFPDDRCYYYGRNQVAYDVIGVTAACLMIEKKKFREVGGFEESIKVAYNDVDFCFKLVEAGYYNVLRNDAVLYHDESLSRGLDEEDEEKWERLLHEKVNLYSRHPGMKGWDGFYHKSLIDNASRYTCNFKFDYEENLKTTDLILTDEGNLARAQKGQLQLTIDRAEQQHKIHLEEPDIMFLMGWSYLPGKDNAEYIRNVVFQRPDGVYCMAAPNPWYREDVEAVLTGQVNISLAGFTLRIKKEKLHSGIWRIGMLATDSVSGQRFLTWSDKEMVVK